MLLWVAFGNCGESLAEGCPIEKSGCRNPQFPHTRVGVVQRFHNQVGWRSRCEIAQSLGHRDPDLRVVVICRLSQHVNRSRSADQARRVGRLRRPERIIGIDDYLQMRQCFWP